MMPPPLRPFRVIDHLRGLTMDLREEDHVLAARVAAGRYTGQRTSQNQDAASIQGQAQALDETGAYPEICLELALGLEPRYEALVLPQSEWGRGICDAHRCEVRGTRYPDGHLLIQGMTPDNPSMPSKDKEKIDANLPFILAILHMQERPVQVDFRGWFLPQNNLRKHWWRENDSRFPRACYAVPQQSLYSLRPMLVDGCFTIPTPTSSRTLLMLYQD